MREDDSLAVDWVVWSMRWIWLACLLLFTYFNPIREDLSLAFLLLGGAATYNLTLVFPLYFKLFPPALSFLATVVDATFFVAFLYASGGGTGPLILFGLFPILVAGFRYDIITSLSVAVIPVLASVIFYFLEGYGTGQVRNPFSLVVNVTVLLLAAALSSRISGKEREVIRNLQATRTRQAIERGFNPYVVSGPVREPNMFFGRQDLLKRIINTLHNNSIMIHGPRRIGKTSLLYQLADRLRAASDPDYAFIPVFIDLEGTAQEKFFHTLMEESLDDSQPHLVERLPSAYNDKDEKAYTHRDFAHDLRTLIDHLQQNTDKEVRLILLLDEVDVMNHYDQLVQQQLRRIFMKNFARNLGAVVAGMHISKEWERLESPWYNLFLEMELPPLSREETFRLIKEPVKGIYSYEDEAVEAIWEYSQGHPQRVQQLCLEAVNRLLREKRSRVTKADVESVYREIAALERV
jgi:hypothetical protein